MGFELIRPMLAHSLKDESVWGRSNFVAETKYDGHRLLVAKNGEVRAWSRNLKEHADEYSWLKEVGWPEGLVLDGELCLPGGRSDDVTELANRDELVYVAFDLLVLDGNPEMDRPWWQRRQLLEMVMEQIGHERIRLSEVLPATRESFERVVKRGYEGLMLKDVNAPYVPGKRTWGWQKAKFEATWDVVITDCDSPPTKWTVRPGHFGTDGVFYPEGKPSSTAQAGYVGLSYGFYIGGELTRVGSLGWTGPREEMEQYVGRVAEVKAMGQYPSGALRHLRFLRWRPDKAATECIFEPEEA